MILSRLQQSNDLQAALAGLEEQLRLEYAQGRIWYEADVQRAVIGFLMDRLSSRDGRWLFGAEHRLDDFFPDVVCYYLSADYQRFLRRPAESVVGVIEIKWRAKLGDDLDKLSRMQERHGCLAWMVYGDHFCPEIHEGYARQQHQRAADIQQWQGQRSSRGQTVLKCGLVEASGSLAAYREILSALNSSGEFWITDQ